MKAQSYRLQMRSRQGPDMSLGLFIFMIKPFKMLVSKTGGIQ